LIVYGRIETNQQAVIAVERECLRSSHPELRYSAFYYLLRAAGEPNPSRDLQTLLKSASPDPAALSAAIRELELKLRAKGLPLSDQ
jgi:hypothetical protein